MLSSVHGSLPQFGKGTPLKNVGTISLDCCGKISVAPSAVVQCNSVIGVGDYEQYLLIYIRSREPLRVISKIRKAQILISRILQIVVEQICQTAIG